MRMDIDGEASNRQFKFIAMAPSDTAVVQEGSHSKDLLKPSGAYLNYLKRLWVRLPGFVQLSSFGEILGRHFHARVLRHAARRQFFGTFFFRNRAELTLMQRLIEEKELGSALRIAVVACSKGAEVYSIVWAIRSERPDLKFSLHAIDISREILEFAARGIYSRKSGEAVSIALAGGAAQSEDILARTLIDQNAPIFERVSDEELDSIADVEGDIVKIKPELKEGITWVHGDAFSRELVEALGPQDIVVANRFLCHMEPPDAEQCLRNVAQMVRPGGLIFVSGIDLDVRTKVAIDLGWHPVKDMIREVHEGDTSLRHGWPVNYWGLEPFDEARKNSAIRYASVFRVGNSTGASARSEMKSVFEESAS